jgi:hypothetical protein
MADKSINSTQTSVDTEAETLLNESLEMLTKYASTINNIKDLMNKGEAFDTALSESCKKANISKSKFAAFLTTKTLGSLNTSEPKEFSSWCDRLLYDITSTELKAPKDFSDALDYVVTHSDKITNLDTTIFYRYYKYGHYVDKICKDLEMEEKSVRKSIKYVRKELENPKNLNLLIKGLSYMENLKSRYTKLKSVYGTELFDSVDKPQTKLDVKKFSTRAINCLEEMQVSTLEELIDKDEKFELYGVNSLGLRTLVELKMLVKQYYNIDILSKRPSKPVYQATWNQINSTVRKINEKQNTGNSK